MNKAYWVALMVTLGGCATNSGIVPVGEGVYTVARQGNGAWVATQDLKEEALREANAYCEGKGKGLKVVNTEETQAKPFGGYPQGKVVFGCT